MPAESTTVHRHVTIVLRSEIGSNLHFATSTGYVRAMPEPADVVLSLLAAVQARDWEAASALLHPALTCEWPHSAELLDGAHAWLALQRDYPEGWSLRVLRHRARDVRAWHELR